MDGLGGVDDEIQRLVGLAADRSLSASELMDRPTLDRHAWRLAAGITLRACDRPVDVLIRQAITLLFLLGRDSDYLFAHGATRTVIIGADTVWKLSLNSVGDSASEIEASASISAPVAPARWQVIAGIQVLEMERVTLVDPDDVSDAELLANPWWTDVDGHELGRRTTGELVVFDAGQFGPRRRESLPARHRARLQPRPEHL